MFNAFATEENLLDSSLPFVGSLDPGIVPSTPPNNGSGSISFIDAPDILELEKLYPVGNPAEPNNKLSLSASLTGSDLIINSISATSATAGTSLNFTYNIKNQGAGNAGANYTGFYLSTDTTLDSSDAYLGYDYVNSLAAGSSSTESASIYLSSSLSVGTYYLFTKADGWGYVSESDETNNVSYQAITVVAPPKPDLIINSISAPSATAGTSLNFTYNIKNQGAGNAGANYTGFYLSTDTTLDSSDTYLGLDDVIALTSGSSSTESASVNLGKTLAAGNYYLFAKADDGNTITESDETNNVSYQAITIQAFDGNTDWFSTNLQDAQLITLTRSLATDGNLSRNDMIALFRDAKDNAVIDANELTDLRTIVSNATLFTMQDYVRVLSDYVVNGNAANQWWTGGGTTRTSLGNLYAGSSDIHMEKLVGKWFLGTDRPDLRTEGDIANQGSGSYTGTKTYRAVSGSLFQNGISADDVKQGAVGDCYYVATLSSIAMEKPNYIQNMFIDNGDNTYTVRFFNNGVANYVTVDNYLPTNSSGSLIYASSGQSYNNSNNELWVALAEKAYAQLAESGWSRPSNVNNGYGSIEGGWMDYVIKQVTGLNSTFNSILNMNETQLINLVNSNQILTAGFVNGGGYGVYNSHAYTITAYNSTTGKFNLRNPWATSHADVTWAELTSLRAYIIYSNT
ncbi:MAG: CARDB domain-containing protein [Dolichospermum sp.]|nr:C2 family cysteine protease [Anabaena sp. 49628_E55]